MALLSTGFQTSPLFLSLFVVFSSSLPLFRTTVHLFHATVHRLSSLHHTMNIAWGERERERESRSIRQQRRCELFGTECPRYQSPLRPMHSASRCFLVGFPRTSFSRARLSLCFSVYFPISLVLCCSLRFFRLLTLLIPSFRVSFAISQVRVSLSLHLCISLCLSISPSLCCSWIPALALPPS